MKKTSERQIELDLLRVVALFFVIFVHICGMKTHVLPVTDHNYQVLTVLAEIVTWQVPAFIMISGRFFLAPERNVTVKKIWGKNIPRLVIAFVIWDLLYQVYYIPAGTYSGLNWKGVLSQIVEGPYPFWYLYMTIGLYMITPFLREITKSKRLMEYYLLLYFVFSFLTKYGVILPMIGDQISTVLEKTGMHFVLGYSGYYVLGYYLCRYPIANKYEIPLYILGIAFAFFAGIGTMMKAVHVGSNNHWFSQYLLPNVVVESAALYIFFVKRVSKARFSEKAKNLIILLSDYSFGVYLVHALIIELVRDVGLEPTMVTPFLMVPVLTMIVFIIGYIATVLLRKIPRVGKLIT